MSDVQLLLNGKIYTGWKTVKVRRSLDLFADTFDLTLTDTQADQARTIKLGTPCRVRIDDETIITGYVDRIRPSYDGKSRSLEVSGRSKTADLVDCSIPAVVHGHSQQNQQSLLELARKFAQYFGISVKSTVKLESKYLSAISESETVFEFLETLAREQGVRLVSDFDGGMVITRASNLRISTALVLGENIEAAEGEFSERDRYSHYYFDGQRRNSDNNDGELSAHVSGKAEDVNVRYRPIVMIAENSIDGTMAKRRAEWQRNVHYGRSRQATYTVNGWRHKDGLWERNTNVLVRDEWMGFTGKDGKGEWLMIGTVEHVLEERGERTRLTVMPREAYDLIPLPADGGGDW